MSGATGGVLMTANDGVTFDHSKLQFPWKVHLMLADVERKGLEHIISWLPRGNGFRVHLPQEFVNGIMAHYFNQTKLKSFQRQLNLWGFHRVLHGPYRGGYTHDCFLKGHPDLCEQMTRQKIKGKLSADICFSKGLHVSTDDAQKRDATNPTTAFSSDVDTQHRREPNSRRLPGAGQTSPLGTAVRYTKGVGIHPRFERCRRENTELVTSHLKTMMELAGNSSRVKANSGCTQPIEQLDSSGTGDEVFADVTTSHREISPVPRQGGRSGAGMKKIGNTDESIQAPSKLLFGFGRDSLPNAGSLLCELMQQADQSKLLQHQRPEQHYLQTSAGTKVSHSLPTTAKVAEGIPHNQVQRIDPFVGGSTNGADSSGVRSSSLHFVSSVGTTPFRALAGPDCAARGVDSPFSTFMEPRPIEHMMNKSARRMSLSTLSFLNVNLIESMSPQMDVQSAQYSSPLAQTAAAFTSPEASTRVSDPFVDSSVSFGLGQI